MKVSAIMPVRDGERYVGDAIRSVVEQTMTDWELIIVDDGSTDSTWSIVSQLEDERVKAHRLPGGKGRGAARNLALERATGELVAICDADDISLPERFERQVAQLEQQPEVGVVASQIAYFDEGTPPHIRVRYPQDPAAIRRRFMRGRSAVPNQSAMIRRSLFEDHGTYAEECLRCQDLEFFLRVLPYTEFLTLDDVLVHYRQASRMRLRYWLENASYQRYASYRARQIAAGTAPAPFSDFRDMSHDRGRAVPDIARFVCFVIRSNRGYRLS